MDLLQIFVHLKLPSPVETKTFSEIYNKFSNVVDDLHPTEDGEASTLCANICPGIKQFEMN